MRFLWILAGWTLLLLPALVLSDGAPAQKQQNPDIGKSFTIPSRLTDAGHILVRAKINGKGPFNFIVDTGAPLVYVSEPAAKKLDIQKEKKGQNTLESFQVEGGPVHSKVKCLVETPYQLEGMNALGLAGVELHGILGYAFLAHYKMEIDLTKDHMTWTKLDYTPTAPLPVGVKGNAPEGLDGLGKLMNSLAKLLGSKGPADPALRGFFGLEIMENGGKVLVQSVLDGGPAATAGLKKGDWIIMVKSAIVRTPAEVREAVARVTAGQSVPLVVGRGKDLLDVAITPAEGL